MQCVVYGTGTTFLDDVLVTLRRLSWEPAGFVAGGDDDVEVPAVPVDPDEIPASWLDLPVVIPVLTSSARRRLVAEAADRGFTRFPAVIDPTAIVADNAHLGEGSFVNAGAILAAHVRVGRFAVINRAVSIGHHGTIADHAFLGPGVTTCGRVVVGESSVIGAGSVIVPGRSVGAACVVAAGSVVLADVPDGTVVRGNPAETVKTGLDRDDTRV